MQNTNQTRHTIKYDIDHWFQICKNERYTEAPNTNRDKCWACFYSDDWQFDRRNHTLQSPMGHITCMTRIKCLYPAVQHAKQRDGWISWTFAWKFSEQQHSCPTSSAFLPRSPHTHTLVSLLDRQAYTPASISDRETDTPHLLAPAVPF